MENFTIFDFLYPTFKITKKIRLIELFAGVGSQAMALREIGAYFEHYKIAEWEVNTFRSYKAIHCENDSEDYSSKYDVVWLRDELYRFGISNNGKVPMTLEQIKHKNEAWVRETYNNIIATHNLVSVTNFHGKDLEVIETDKFVYILCYSFPCQDLSVAGKMAGMAKGSGTRSGMLWEVERLLDEMDELPQVLLMENVPQVISSDNIDDFHMWQQFLESKGYTNYVQVLNAKDFGVPQNRERCFMVSILGNYNYKFPPSKKLEVKLKDILEPIVNEKYYLTDQNIAKIKNSSFAQEQKIIQESDVCGTLLARDYKDPKCVIVPSNANVINKWYEKEPDIEVVGMLDIKGNDQIRRVYGCNGLSPTLNTMQGGNRQPKVLIPQATKEGFIVCDIPGIADLSYPESKTRRGRVQENGQVCPTLTAAKQDLCYFEPIIVASRGRNPDNPSDRTAGNHVEQRLEPNTQGISNTITTVQKDNYVMETPYRIRKLTPKECWRLMDFLDSDFEKAAAVNSETQLYKEAGNSIVKAVLMAIFIMIISPEKLH